jgi:hypothetical protein
MLPKMEEVLSAFLDPINFILSILRTKIFQTIKDLLICLKLTDKVKNLKIALRLIRRPEILSYLIADYSMEIHFLEKRLLG